MLMGKAILWLSAVAFIAYGLASLLSPAIPAGFAGIELGNGDAFAEIGAMYGGLQTGVGLFCLLAVRRQEFYRSGLVLLVLGIGALALARAISAFVTSESLTNYTYAALVYEFATAIIATLALRTTTSRSTLAD